MGREAARRFEKSQDSQRGLGKGPKAPKNNDLEDSPAGQPAAACGTAAPLPAGGKV